MAENFGQLDDLKGGFQDSFSVEEMDSLIAVADESERVALRSDRRELIEIAKSDDLTAAERLVGAAGKPHFGIYHINNVCTNHRNFVDYQTIKATKDGFDAVEVTGDFFVVFRILNVGSQAEKRVNSLAADVQRGDTGGRDDSNLFFSVFDEILKEDGFAGAGFTGDKIIIAGFLEEFVNFSLLFTKFQRGKIKFHSVYYTGILGLLVK